MPPLPAIFYDRPTLMRLSLDCTEPTVFIVKPEDITPTFPDPVSFYVKARSDPDTTITYRWYHYDEDSDCEKKWCMVYNVADKTYVVNEDGSVLTILKTEENDLGAYRCVASNGVRDHSYTVQLIAPQYLRLYSVDYLLVSLSSAVSVLTGIFSDEPVLAKFH